MPIFKLYTTKAKSSEEMDKLRMQFQEIYNKHNIDIVGFWINAEAEDEFYYMSKYEDENDYHKKVELLKQDEEYKHLTEKVKNARTSFDSKTLIPKWTVF